MTDSPRKLASFNFEPYDRQALQNCILFNGRPKATPPVGERLHQGVIDALYQKSVPHTYEPGEPIIVQGRMADVVGILVYGYATVAQGGDVEDAYRHHSMLLYNVGPSEAFGITKLADRQPHYASVKATMPTRVLILKSEDIFRVFKTTEVKLDFYTNLSVYLALKFKQRGDRLSVFYRTKAKRRLLYALAEIEANHRKHQEMVEKGLSCLDLPEIPFFDVSLLASWVGGTPDNLVKNQLPALAKQPAYIDYEVKGDLVIFKLLRPVSLPFG